MRVFTIGFTKKSAEQFFDILRTSGAGKLVDVRLNNVSQLSAFAKRDDLKYFLREICAMDYAHDLRLAPTQDLLDGYKKLREPWPDYEAKFLELMSDRAIERTIDPHMLDDSVLLCSEATPHQCHRRLVAEYLSSRWGDLEIVHL